MSVAIFDDLEGLAVEVEDRVVGGLDPDFLAALADALVFGGLEFAVVEVAPELPVLGAGAVGRLDEQAVMLALDLVQPIAERLEEVVVGGDDRAVHVELDDRLGLADGGDLALVVGVLQLRGGDIRGELDDLERLAVEVEDRVVGAPESRPPCRPCRCACIPPAWNLPSLRSRQNCRYSALAR